MLHVWLVNRRIMAEGATMYDLQQEFFDRVWEEAQQRVRGTGVRACGPRARPAPAAPCTELRVRAC